MIYTGSPQGVDVLAAALREEGLAPRFEPPPDDERGIDDTIVQVLFWIVQQGAAGLVGGAATTAAYRAKAKLLKRFPRSRVEIEPPTET